MRVIKLHDKRAKTHPYVHLYFRKFLRDNTSDPTKRGEKGNAGRDVWKMWRSTIINQRE